MQKEHKNKTLSHLLGFVSQSFAPLIENDAKSLSRPLAWLP